MPGEMVSLLALKRLKASRVTRRCGLSYPAIGLASALWQWARFSFPSSHLFRQRLSANFAQHDKRLIRLLVKQLIVKTIKLKEHLSSNSSHSAFNPSQTSTLAIHVKLDAKNVSNSMRWVRVTRTVYGRYYKCKSNYTKIKNTGRWLLPRSSVSLDERWNKAVCWCCSRCSLFMRCLKLLWLM